MSLHPLAELRRRQNEYDQPAFPDEDIEEPSVRVSRLQPPSILSSNDAPVPAREFQLFSAISLTDIVVTDVACMH